MNTSAPNTIVFHYDSPDGSASPSITLSAAPGAGKGSYEDIDRWLRQRLGFGGADRLKFLNKKGEGEAFTSRSSII
jgi:hypothetical protein